VDLGHGLLGLVGVGGVVDDDGVAVAAQTHRAGAPDAPRSAGDDGDPTRLLATHADSSRLCVLQAPPEIDTLRYHMAWHPRLDTDPVHSWLRDNVRACCTE
jgi:DNA-binding transcriptional LysR family regulator